MFAIGVRRAERGDADTGAKMTGFVYADGTYQFVTVIDDDSTEQVTVHRPDAPTSPYLKTLRFNRVARCG